ncbi:MAG: hypothetical protein JNK25_14995 [Phycisphaerae bacterium]|nr:hypothetical protein [Phycisphaerae bacterium]
MVAGLGDHSLLEQVEAPAPQPRQALGGVNLSNAATSTIHSALPPALRSTAGIPFTPRPTAEAAFALPVGPAAPAVTPIKDSARRALLPRGCLDPMR